MKHPFLRPYVLLAAMAAVFASCQPRGWELVWCDDFSSGQLDTAVWSRIPRGTPDWQNTQQPSDPRLIGWRNGNIVLRGIVNDRLDVDTAHYLTGGIWTKDKKSFARGKHASRVVVRAKLQGARGAWPAIWLMPFDNGRWPTGGEIDIMERLNYDSIAYQTVHSPFTQAHPRKQHGGTAPIRPDDFNDYGVDIYPDSIVFHINGVRTYTYSRDASVPDGERQFPFFRDQHLRIDQQLGGSWVGKVSSADLPVEMEVDWVRHYLK